MRRPRLLAPQLDRPWRDVEYCVLDFETTGLDLRRDEIVSYGLVLVRAGRVQCASARYGLVQPGRRVSVPAIRVHGLRENDLQLAPPLADVLAADLVPNLRGRVLVAHAAWLESALLRRALQPLHLRPHAAVVDTARLAIRAELAGPDTGFEPSLEWLAGQVRICVHQPHHALGDALTTGETFLAVASMLERRHPAETGRRMQAGDLVQWSAR